MQLPNERSIPERFFAVLAVIAAVLFFFFIGTMVGYMLFNSLTGMALEDVIPTFSESEMDRNTQIALLITQGTAQLVGLLALPLLMLYYYRYELAKKIISLKAPSPQESGLTVLIVILVMPFLGLIVEWNATIELPDALGSLKNDLVKMESDAEKITNHLIHFETFGMFALGSLVIAVIPAIVEEFSFRGILQNEIRYLFNNKHLAIWSAGFLFSFIHFQFFGFVPRMLLGVLFGYLYVWSGNILIPVLAHFTNNFFTLLLSYMYQNRVVDYNIQEVEGIPLPAALFSLVVTIALIYLFKKSTPAHDS